MSNRMKLKKHKTKEEPIEDVKEKEVTPSKHGAKFLKNKREKGTAASNFAGKSSKEFSRKKT